MERPPASELPPLDLSDLVAQPRLARPRPAFATIDLARLAGNPGVLRQRVGGDVALLPVLKADAYGHGAAGTVAYEVRCAISPHVPRVYVEEGRVVEVRDRWGGSR